MGRILVTGASGMLARAVIDEFSHVHEIFPVDVVDFDVTVEDEVRGMFNAAKPDVVMHLAAYTDVDGAEDDGDACREVNVRGSRLVAEAAGRAGALVVSVSTDYIFDGTKDAPYAEEDEPNPLSVYGKSKLDGERAVVESGAEYLVVRTSWLFGAGGGDFPSKILEKAGRGKQLRVVDDQVGAPTWTRHLAGGIKKLIENKAVGVYNLTNSGYVSWFGFSRKIIELSDLDNKPAVVPVKSEEFSARAKRPKNSRLDCSKYVETAGEPLPSWEEALVEYFRETGV